jgi:hypothetical protein
MKAYGLLPLVVMTIATITASQGRAQTKTVVLFAPFGAGTNITITVATNEVFELLYVNWPGVQANNTFCHPFVAVNIGGVNVKDNGYDDLLQMQQQRSTLAGPATIRLESNIDCGGTYVFTYRITRQVDTFAPNTGVVIPADAGGPVSVILETSTNFVTWTDAQPGTYGVSSAARYFRLRAVRN